ncbi:hypothetical protein TSOC_013455, partial [Tetrabaena socialis]
MEEDFTLADLGVTARSAALVEEVIQEGGLRAAAVRAPAGAAGRERAVLHQQLRRYVAAAMAAVMAARRTAQGQRPSKKARAAGAEAEGGEANPRAGGSGSGGRVALVETEKDRLIRAGQLTPFDRLAGFERKMQSAAPPPPPRSQLLRPAAAGRRARTVARRGGRQCGGGLAQAAGYGALRHLGRSELRSEEAAARTRSGRWVDEVIEEAGRRALAARAARHTTTFLEPEQLPP